MKKVLFLLTLGIFLSADPIKIAMDNLYPPFEYPDSSGKTIGFDVDLAAELAKRVGFQYEIIKLDYDSICKAINEKKVDIGISAFGDDEATAACDHGVSYFESELLFVKDKSRNDINSLEDLNGKKVAYDSNSALKDAIINLGGKPVPKKSGTFIATLLLLHEGKVDSVVIDSCNAPVLKGNLSFLTPADKNRLDLISGGLGNFTIYHEQPGDDSETFVIFPKDGSQEDLKNKINDAIVQMRNDGTIQNLLNKYGLK
ncbi:MAG: amino acid ABC transporter substrate-binding protein [Campylobacter sp.]|nr:amino acid ABC transporter substrate-binding protein [Campylobacter sp.]